MKRKVVSVLLACVLCASLLAGCGGLGSLGFGTDVEEDSDEEDEDSSDKKDKDSEDEDSSDEEDKDSGKDSAEEEDGDSAVQGEDEPEEASNDEAGDMDLGSWDGNTYRNDWLEVTFALPDDWMVLNGDQILQVLGAGSEVISNDLGLDGDSLSAQISETDYYAYYTLKVDGGAYFFLDIFDKAAAGVPNMTTDEYLQQSAALFNAMSSIDVEIGDPEEAALGGKAGKGVMITMSANDVTSQLLYLAIDMEDYIAVYCFSANTQEGADDITALIDQMNG